MFGLVNVVGEIKTKTPLFHGGNEKTGSVVLLNRIKFLTEDGIEEIPVISGNAIRGYLRRLIMTDMLRLIDYELNMKSIGGQKLYHSLFAGGILETVSSKSSGVIDLGMKKRIWETLLPIRLFGFSIGNQMIEGKLKVGYALPICKELKDYLPPNIQVKYSIYELLNTTFQTRRDELRTEREDEEQAVQMLIEHEVFTPGTKFYHEFKIEDPEDIDLSTFARVLELWKQKPYIGGKSSIGYGEIQIKYDYKHTSKKYHDFLKTNKEKIYELLEELSEYATS